MIVVSDTSALICLARIKQLEILNKLYKQVVVPQEVYYEIAQKESSETEYLLSYLSDKIWKDTIVNEIINPSFNSDKGEYDCINLCLTIENHEEIEDDYKLLIDDKMGRKIAQENDISVIGSIGVLRASIRKGILNNYDEINEIIQNLSNEIDNNNLRIPKELMVKELTQAMKIKNIEKETVSFSFSNTRRLR